MTDWGITGLRNEEGSSQAVFLDRDGVINRRVVDRYVRDWSEFSFLPGTVRAIRMLKELGFLVVVVTNQQGIGRGLMTEADLHGIHRRMIQEMERGGSVVDAVYYCPHTDESACPCRKPETGMLDQAARELKIELGRSYMVGDSPSDVEAARRAGCRPVFIGIPEDRPEKDCPVFPDLLSFADFLTREDGRAFS